MPTKIQTACFKQNFLLYLGANASASQLAVIDFNVVPLHGLLHTHQGICRHLTRTYNGNLKSINYHREKGGSLLYPQLCNFEVFALPIMYIIVS